MAVNDSEKKSRAILEAKAESGKEFQQFQEAQGQLLNIQAEQRNNLNQQRVASGMEAQNNQTLAQAAEILAASGGAAGGVVAAPVVQPQITAPGTKAVLSKFGISRPGTKTISNTQRTQTPQKISITNNTVTTNNNNIQLTQPQIPMTAPVIPMRAGNSGGDTAKFKAWISNAFAKQNEAAAIREKEYQKREWSLTRSANKMIRKMGELGKSFAETLNPKNLGNIMGDQLKTVMFMLGFQFLASNFDKVLGFAEKIKGVVDNISEFTSKTRDVVGKIYDFFTGDNFSKKIKEFIGGKKDETFAQAFKGLFDDIVDRIGDKFEILLENRGRAVKEVKFPKLNLSDGIENVIMSIGGYLGDVFSAALSGSKGVSNNIIRTIKQEGMNLSLGDEDYKYSQTQDATGIIKNGSNVSFGDAVMADNKFMRNFKMESSDYNNGVLSNNTGSSVKQGQYLSNLVADAESGKSVDLNQFISGFSALKKTITRKGGALVSLSTIIDICRFFNIPEEANNIVKLCKKVWVRYIVVDKSTDELSNENAGDFMSNFIYHTATSNAISKSLGGLTSYGKSVGEAWEKGNYVESVIQATIGSIGSQTRGFINATAQKSRSLAVDKRKLKMVRVGDDRYPENIYPTVKGKDNKELVDNNNNTYYELTPEAIREIETKASAKSNNEISFDFKTIDQIRHLGDLMKKYSGSTGLNNETENAILALSELGMEERALQEYYDIEHSTDRVAKLGTNVSELAENTLNQVDRAVDYVKSTLGMSVPLNKGKQRDNALYIMDRLMDELGLTKEQAAGIVGNLMAESSLNPTAINPDREARGIAQWRGDRRENFRKKYGREPNEASLEDQVTFLINELNTTHKEFVDLAKKSNSSNVADMSDLATGHFEFSVGVDGIKNKAGDPNEKYRKNFQEIVDSLPIRRKYAGDILSTYEESLLPNVVEEGGESSNVSNNKNQVMITDTHDAKLFSDYASLDKTDLIKKLVDEGTYYAPTDTEDGDEYFYNNGRLRYTVSEKYFNDNMAKPGSGEVNKFDAMGIVTDILKNSPEAMAILNGTLKQFKRHDHNAKLRIIEKLARILGDLKYNPNSYSDAGVIQEILRPYIEKLRDVNNPILASNIWYHLPKDKRLDIIKKFTTKGRKNEKNIDDYEAGEWYRHLESKIEKINAKKLLFDKYGTLDLVTPVVEQQQDLHPDGFFDFDSANYLDYNNYRNNLPNQTSYSSSSNEESTEITPSPAILISKKNLGENLIETSDIEYTSEKNQSEINAIARFSADSIQLRTALDNRDTLATVNHNIVVVGKQMATISELLVQGNYFSYLKGGSYIPYTQYTTSTNDLPSSNLK